nr:putative disease resistance rpp13-like protein 1 [Quercus suber]
MAGALVGGAFLSAFLQVAFDRLASRDFLHFLKGKEDIEGSLNKLKKLLRSASVVLADAEAKQYTNSAVKEWLDELKHTVYGADDILDEIGYEALRCKVSGFIPTSVPLFNTKIKSELETILKELELRIKEKDDLSLEKADGGVRTRELTDFLPEEYGVFGRNADVEAIFQKFQPASVNDGICVVPIVDNSEAKMEEMPPHMDKLKNLRKLPVFGVGKHDDGSSIKELGELQHLSGKLSLLNLENVQCINKDTTGVILKNKQDLSELELEWKHGHGAEDSEKERILLEQLCPCTNLNSLTITNYEGTSFPKWLGDSSFSKMVSIELRNCDNCFSLPPLGQLPDLKSLEIERFGKISSVGLEFYGNTINPFRALEYLSFKNMPEWQEWVLFKGEVFTCLRELHIEYCPKLIGGLPLQLPSLTKLDISGKSVNIKGSVCSILPSLSEFASVTHLKLFWCPDLVSFPSGGLCPPHLSEIVIKDCENLESLPEGMRTLLPSLVRLELLRCPKLNSFPEGGLPSSLESLLIDNCNTLFSHRMQWGLQDLRSLRSFTIIDEHNKLESFPEDALLPPNLTDLYITLSNLESLNGKGFQHLTSLKHLKIWSCDDLDCLLEEVLPPSLCELDIFNCHLLKERPLAIYGEGANASVQALILMSSL